MHPTLGIAQRQLSGVRRVYRVLDLLRSVGCQALVSVGDLLQEQDHSGDMPGTIT